METAKTTCHRNLTLTPLSHVLIAISKAYHEYNPLLIKTFNALLLLNGVNCITTNQNGGNHVLPISKCEILGIVRLFQQKANGSVLLILDDGTGICDCVGWINDFSKDIDRCGVGDVVRISGAIKVLSVKRRRLIQINGISHEGWSCIRELRVHTIDIINDRHLEALHWLACVQFRKRIGSKIEPTSEDELLKMSVQSQIMNTPVLNGLETFFTLPNEDKDHVLSTRGSVDYFVSSGGNDQFLIKYFGRDCKCKMDYKDKLLYCHCLATLEPLDPKFLFRDFLLNMLLKMEARIGKDLVYESASTAYSGGCRRKLQRKLEFKYRTTIQNISLREIAKKVVSKTADPIINLRRLYSNTFRHLRNDGVIHLADSDADIYWLVSTERVLVPLVSSFEWERDCSSKNVPWNHVMKQVPEFLQKCVSAAKLNVVRKLIQFGSLDKR